MIMVAIQVIAASRAATTSRFMDWFVIVIVPFILSETKYSTQWHDENVQFAKRYPCQFLQKDAHGFFSCRKMKALLHYTCCKQE